MDTPADPKSLPGAEEQAETTLTSDLPGVERLGPVAGRDIRVVLFCGGPYMERGLIELLLRLEAEPGVDLRGTFCESAGGSVPQIMLDLWRRRGLLALPVMLVQIAGVLHRWIRSPGKEWTLRKRFAPLLERIRFVPNLHARDVLDRVRSLEPDLGLVYGGPILKVDLFEIPRFGTLGLHHGKLPQYRGKKTTFWAMARGESAAGVTIQKIGPGLDTGSIVESGEVPTGGLSYRRVWQEVEKLGVDLYVRAVLETKLGQATCVEPIGDRGPLYRDPKLGDLLRFQWLRLTGRR